MFINALVNEAKVNKLSTNQDQCYLSRLAKRSAAFGWKGGDLWDQPEAFFIFQFFLNPTITFFIYIRRYFPHEGGHRGESRLYCPRTK